MRPWSPAVFLVPVLAGSGCFSEGGLGAFSDPDPDFDDTAAMIEVQQGSVTGGRRTTTIVASLVADDPFWPYEVEEPIGACRFSLQVSSSCESDCTGVCVDGVCKEPPVPQEAGELTVTTSSVHRTLSFGEAGYYDFADEPLFAPGETVTVRASGGAVPAFEFAAQMPEPIRLSDVGNIRVRIGESLTLRWESADTGSRVRLLLGADLYHASFRSALIECDVPDEWGGVTIPRAMMDRFLDPDLWGCGFCIPHSLRRYNRVRGTAGDLALTLWATEMHAFNLW